MNPTVQRIVGTAASVAGLAIVLVATIWVVLAIGNSNYHECLKKNDSTYPELGPEVRWPPATNAAAKHCADKNFLPERFLG